ncbi:MAG: cell division protein FtsK [Cellvibrionales bacterium TMED49]|nr:MAG: cell division protein FtsK [Cellvibrionales bacterium TMED49]
MSTRSNPLQGKRKSKLENNTETSFNDSRLQRIFSEGALIGLILLCAVIFVALITHSPDDPSWSTTGAAENVMNAIGPFGAHISDGFYNLFGIIAFLFPGALALRAAQKLRQYFKLKNDEFSFESFFLMLLGFILIMLSATALAHLLLANLEITFDRVGGITGEIFGNALIEAFNRTGSILILISLFLFGISVFGDISWLSIVSKCYFIIFRATKEISNFINVQRIKREELKETKDNLEARRTRVVEKMIKKAGRIPPVIKLPLTQTKHSDRSAREKQGMLFNHDEEIALIPALSLLDPPEATTNRGYSEDSLGHYSRLLENKLHDFGISVDVVSVLPGPVITRFEIQPAPGVKVSRISALAKDLARSMAVPSVRVVEVISGKSVVGIEIPNDARLMVRLSEVLLSEVYEVASSPLTLALGHDISGSPVIADLAKMPHLLVAGTTGSGKSVGINAMLLSLLFKSSAEEVKLILVDPKMLELSVYDGIPHLLTPVITDMKDASVGLRWCVGEMEHRYQLMSSLGVRNIAGFNRKIEEAKKNNLVIPDPLWNADHEQHIAHDDYDSFEPPALDPLPYIVVVIDEFADMMMIVGKKVEQLIARISQKARAAGIHLILATQRPSVDVITGLIKANVPSRIAFQVSSKIDSRTILDQAGAEQLLGHGDMLYLAPGKNLPERVHGAFVDDSEVHRVVGELKRRGTPSYVSKITDESEMIDIGVPGVTSDKDTDQEEKVDPLYVEAVSFVIESQKASISSVQRKLRIGYNRAARLIERMEDSRIISPMGTNGTREVLTDNNDLTL